MKNDDIKSDLDLEPMNSFYRKYVYDMISEYKGITAKTVGTDPNKHLKI